MYLYSSSKNKKESNFIYILKYTHTVYYIVLHPKKDLLNILYKINIGSFSIDNTCPSLTGEAEN